LTAFAAALAFAAPAAAETATVAPLSLASATSPFATCPDTMGFPFPSINYLNAEVEPFVAVNPRNSNNVIGVYQQDRFGAGGGAHALGAASSFDGGVTWTHSFPHFDKCAGGTAAGGTDYDRVSDPWVSIGPDGTAYFIGGGGKAALTITAVLASTSTDGGLHWSEPVTIQRDNSPSGFVGNDKPSVTADPAKPATAYVVWTRFRFPSATANGNAAHSWAFRGDPYFAMTTDGGGTWSTPRNIAPQNQLLNTTGAEIAVLPDGTLLDVYSFDKGKANAPNAAFIGLQRSADGGNTWSKVIAIADNPAVDDVDPDTGKLLRTGANGGFGASPGVAVDPGSGAVYVVWEDSRFSGGAHNDIAMSKSTDGGLRWSPPVKINQSPPSVTAFTPAVDVLPDGTVGVTYYDLRNNTPDPTTLPTDHFIVHSHDGGATWSEARITPTSFDDTTAPDSRGYFLGDYQGLANDGSVFKPLFVQTNSGNLSNRTDVFGTTVTP
jgi:hypothetical protein